MRTTLEKISYTPEEEQDLRRLAEEEENGKKI
ncbi:hypothetical protein SDC9_63441 [bioreactor metagenome]|uniref:Uncharacterized protein n=1 Tax=bioreactor metagenome TaxID=1076179 RepID=A0A644XM54_9ZZZZ